MKVFLVLAVVAVVVVSGRHWNEQQKQLFRFDFPKENEKIAEIKEKTEELYRMLPKDMQEDANLRVPDLIRKYGYPCEVHTLQSPDGYVMEMHRISYGKKGPSENRPAVYLQHGLLSSSADWIITGTQKGMGYYLADAGYDVWIPNVRGNRYGRKHAYLDLPKDEREFWDFSWHEIAVHDISTMIDYVIEKTGQKSIYHIGHSQGTTTFYVLMSEKPEYNDKIRAHFSMAPVAYMSNIGSPLLQAIAFFQGPLDVLFSVIGIYEFLPNDGFLGQIGDILCGDHSILQVLCTNTLFAIAGFNPKQMNATLLPMIMGHTPAGASTKQVTHYAQEVNSGKFRKYDHGLLGNIKQYGWFLPPNYELSNVKAPVYLFYSKNDWMSDEKDVLKLYSELGNVKGKFLVPDAMFTHFDYIFGIDAHELVYKRIVSLMRRH